MSLAISIAAASALAAPTAASTVPKADDDGGVSISMSTASPSVGAFISPDPGAPGPLRVKSKVLDRGLTAITLTAKAKAQDASILTYPVSASGRITAANGSARLPVVVFIHGNHAKCDPSSDIYPCQQGARVIPSYLGYQQIANRLASRGFLVLSVAVVGQGDATNTALVNEPVSRTAIVEHHLRRLVSASRTTSTPWGSLLVGRVNTSKILLIGHSRGGQVAVDVANRSLSGTKPYRIASVMTLASTETGTALARLPLAVVLSECDGDVTDLTSMNFALRSAAVYHDNPLRTIITLPGANHNFFNTIWSPGSHGYAEADDDADRAGNIASRVDHLYQTPSGITCQPGKRISRKTQSTWAASYVTAWARLTLQNNSTAMRVFDGRRAQMRSAGTVPTWTTLVSARGMSALVKPTQVPTSRSAGAKTTTCRPGVDCATRSSMGFPTFEIGRSANLRGSGAAGQRITWSGTGASASWTAGGSRAVRPGQRLLVTWQNECAPPLTGPDNAGALPLCAGDRRHAVSLVLRDSAGRTLTVPLRRGDLNSGLHAFSPGQASVSYTKLRSLSAAFKLNAIRTVGIKITGGPGSAALLGVYVAGPTWLASCGSCAPAPPTASLPVSTKATQKGDLSFSFTTTVTLNRASTKAASLMLRVETPTGVVRIPVVVPAGSTSKPVKVNMPAGDYALMGLYGIGMKLEAVSNVTIRNDFEQDGVAVSMAHLS